MSSRIYMKLMYLKYPNGPKKRYFIKLCLNDLLMEIPELIQKERITGVAKPDTLIFSVETARGNRSLDDLVDLGINAIYFTPLFTVQFQS